MIVGPIQIHSVYLLALQIQPVHDDLEDLETQVDPFETQCQLVLLGQAFQLLQEDLLVPDDDPTCHGGRWLLVVLAHL